MSNPDTVPACIKALSSATFVAEVTAPALAVLVPLLLRALNDRSMEVQRRTVVVIENLVKLVRNPQVAARYLSPLVDGVKKIAESAAFPEVSNRVEECHLVYSLISPVGPRVCGDRTKHAAEVRSVIQWYSSSTESGC
jgi:hypothetical protein